MKNISVLYLYLNIHHWYWHKHFSENSENSDTHLLNDATETSKNYLSCSVCNINVNNDVELRQHLVGQKHKKAYRLMEEQDRVNRKCGLYIKGESSLIIFHLMLIFEIIFRISQLIETRTTSQSFSKFWYHCLGTYGCRFFVAWLWWPWFSR